MKQLTQNFKTGETNVVDVPLPRVGKGEVLIKSKASLVSLGTERMLVSFGKASLLGKVKQQPERVQEVLNKMKTDGVATTLQTVNQKLDTPITLGYSQAGIVEQVGSDVEGFKVGDRVISNGPHAEYVCVPKNLVAKIPDNVSFEEAAFTVVSSIGLQGIRLVNPTFGETIVVFGLGLIGLITVQLLKSNGCRVIGIDLDEEKVNIAKSFGVEALNAGTIDPVEYIISNTKEGADGVLITASTKSNEVIRQAAQLSRKRGRIVLVGVIGLDLKRADFYEKELSFQVSCSYGPGRYTVDYEQNGQDYPLPFVRWTENRNFQAILEALSNNNLNVQSLITKKADFSDFSYVYEGMQNSNSIATIFTYGKEVKVSRTIKITDNEGHANLSNNSIMLIGAGNYTNARVLPALKKSTLGVAYVASSKGLSSSVIAKKINAIKSTTDYLSALEDRDVNHVLITTRHNLHSPMVLAALQADKNVFVEKPLALSSKELQEIVDVYGKHNGRVDVGFNRRFSPHSLKVKQLLGHKPEPMTVVATMNAGFIPSDSWVQDIKVGGGRIIGEACHLIDLVSFFTESEIVEVYASSLGTDPTSSTDVVSIHLKYLNGSLGVINYLANGHKSYPKEKIEVFYQGKNLVIDNFRRTFAYGFKSRSFLSNRILKTKQDKGHNRQFELLLNSWDNGGKSLIEFKSLINTSLASIKAIESIERNQPMKVRFE